MLVTVSAIALGVALGAAVYLVNNAALNEFGLATKRLVGEADVVVRGPREGFSEQLLTELAANAAVSEASPVLELDVALPGRRDTLKVLGIDPFRAATLQTALIGDIGGSLFSLFQRDSIYLSSSAARELQLRPGDALQVIVGSTPTALHVLGILSEGTYSQALGADGHRLGAMDFQSNRPAESYRFTPEIGQRRRRLSPQSGSEFAGRRSRRRPASRARPGHYRDARVSDQLEHAGAGRAMDRSVPGFSTQSLSVLRRRRSLALLRALGVTRSQLQAALVGEGAALGVVGSFLGVILGMLFAAAILRFLTGDLGNGQLHAAGTSLRTAPLPLLAFFVMGTGVAAIGAWMPARAAARQPPARSLKGGDGDFAVVARTSAYSGVALLALGAVLSRLPPLGGLPVFGYAAIAALLFGAVLLVPTLTVKALSLAPHTHRIVLDAAVAQLRENVGLSTLSLASIIVSFSLMVAMAIMVYSFRVSFDQWLGKLLPADMQLREPLGSDTAYWSMADQAKLAAAAGISRIEFRRTRQLMLDPARAPVTLISRGATAAQAAEELPLVRSTKLPLPSNAEPAWISEALQDLYGYQLGSTIYLPLAGRSQRFTVAGIWRDYARMSGSIVISRQAYLAATGDDSAQRGFHLAEHRRRPPRSPKPRCAPGSHAAIPSKF